MKTASLETLAKERKRMQTMTENCCTYYSGEMRLVMEEMQQRIATQLPTKRQLRATTGKPDEIIAARKLYLKYDGKEQVARRVWVYHWRSRHDFLYCYFKRNRVVAVEWFYAYE